MAKTGTRVGNAYIALTVDGDGVNKDIADSIDPVDADRAADKFSKAYVDRINENLEKGLGQSFKDALDNMDKALAESTLRSKSVTTMLEDAANQGDLDALFKRVGKDAGAGFGKSFDDVVKVSVLNSIESALEEAARNGDKVDLTDLLFEKDGAQTLGPFFDKAVRDAETGIKKLRATQEREFNAAFDSMYKQEQAWIKANDKMKFEGLKNIADQAKKMAEDDARADQARLDFVEKFQAQREKMHEQSNRVIAESDAALLRSQHALMEKLEAQRDKDILALIDRSTKAEIKREKLIWDVRNKTLKAYAKYQRDLDKGRIDAFGNEVSRNRGADKSTLGTLMGWMTSGRAFGRGSRMDGLHYIGSVVGLMVRAVVGGLKLAGKAVTTFTNLFMEGMTNAAESATTLQRVMSGFANVGAGVMSALGQMIATGPIGWAILAGTLALVAASMGVVFAAAVILASAMSALLGIVTALVGVISLGLVGGMTILAASFAPVIAAAGLATAAFMSMTDKQKSLLKDAFIPLREQMVGIGQTIIKDMVPAFDTWASNLQRALQLTVPAAKQMGGAFAEAGNIITASLSGPGFQNFANMMALYMPRIILNLSNAFGNFLNGVMGLFAALTPAVLRFSQYLTNVTNRFSEWANSAAGKNSIEDFALKAEAALKALWGTITSTGGLIKDILFNDDVQAGGISMFDRMTAAIERMRDEVAKAAADGRLKKWMYQAEKFGSALWGVMVSLAGVFQRLSDDGTIDAVSDAIQDFSKWVDDNAGTIEVLSYAVGTMLPAAFSAMMAPLSLATGALELMKATALAVADAINSIPAVNIMGKVLGGGGGNKNPRPKQAPFRFDKPTTPYRLPGQLSVAGGGINLMGSPGVSGKKTQRGIDKMEALGRRALARTSAGRSGGNGGGRSGSSKADEWTNPYKKMAERLIKEGPSLAKQMRAAMRGVVKGVRAAMKEADDAMGRTEARSIIRGAINDLKDAGKAGVEEAQAALNSAASSLASASDPAEARKALREIGRAQRDLDKAQKNQRILMRRARILAKQNVVNDKRVDKLMNGVISKHTKMAEFAVARALIATKLEAANEKLEAAISLRDSFRDQVTDAVKSFGGLLTAQGQMLNGVEQAVTAGDIVGNLEARLAEIQTFRTNMQRLLAMGLSKEAYKQILDGGVEAGGAYAAALLAGGAGAIQKTNGLVSSIDTLATSLGLETSNQMYQAGVNAAQGLVNGLTSLSKDLDSAAAKLGTSIANAIKRSLGIKSPSRVMFDTMQFVGDGMVGGLDAQHSKVGSAASALANVVAVSPEVARYAAANGTSPTVPVSGNSTTHHWHITTATEDPKAVAQEMINEVTGRL